MSDQFAILGKITVGGDAGASIKSLDGQLDQVKGKMDAAWGETSPAQKGMMIAGAGVTAFGVKAAGSMNDAADAAVGYGQQIVNVQRLTGLGAKESSDAAALMDRYNISGKQLGAVFKTLDTQIIAKDTAKSTTALHQMGIATEDANGKARDSVSVLADVAEYYSKSTDKTTAAALASKVLGKNFMALMPVLSGGKKAIADVTAEAHKNGLELTQNQIGAVKEYGKLTKDNAEAQKGLTVQFGLMVLPIKTLMAQGLNNLLAWFNSAPGPLKSIIGGLAIFVTGLALIGGPLLMIVGALPMLTAGFSVVGGIIGTIAGAFSAEGIAAAAAWVATLGPIALIIAAIALVAFAVYEVIKHWDVIGPFFKKLWTGVASGASTAWNGITNWFKGMFAKLRAFFGTWGTVILSVLVPFIGVPLFIIQHWNVIGPWLAKFWGGIQTAAKNTIDSVVGFFHDLPGRIFNALVDLGRTIEGPISKALGLLGNLNPFQRHSPSLVDNVLAGIGVIGKAWSSLGGMQIAAPTIGGIGAGFGGMAMAGAGGSYVGGSPQYHLHINSSAKTEPIVADFQMLKAMSVRGN